MPHTVRVSFGLSLVQKTRLWGKKVSISSRQMAFKREN
ncbi:Hypothetical protein ABZS17G119_02746 [Kosakonia cowanii]